MSTTHPETDRPRSLEALVERARGQGRVRMVIAAADEAYSLAAAVEAAQLGFVSPTLIGAGERIRQAADEAELDIHEFELIESTGDSDAAQVAVRMAHDGSADLVMKGSLSTKVLMRAVLNHEFGLSTGGLLSHVAAFDAPDDDRLILLTDAGVSVNPRFARKMEIIVNVVGFRCFRINASCSATAVCPF